MTSLWRAELPGLHEMPPADRGCGVLVIGAGVVGLTAAARLALAGRRVVVIDAVGPGAGTTGRSTGKVTLLQGTRLGEIARHNAPGTAAAERRPAMAATRARAMHGPPPAVNPVERRDARCDRWIGGFDRSTSFTEGDRHGPRRQGEARR